MSPKSFIYIGVAIGSTVGSCIPLLWGDSAFSFTALFFSALGTVVGIWLGYQLSQRW